MLPEMAMKKKSIFFECKILSTSAAVKGFDCFDI
jgi:hypothetical protein